MFFILNVFYFQCFPFLILNIYCDGMKAKPKNRQICLARRDNNQADALQRMKDKKKKVESYRRAVKGLVVTLSVS